MAFFFKPVSTLNILDVSEFPRLNRDGHLHQEGKDEKSCCPDAKGDHEFQEVRHVIVDLSQRVRDESRYDQTGSLFNPYPDDDEQTAEIESGKSFPGGGDEEEERRP